MMFATTMNAAISERARSSVFDLGIAAVASSRGNDNFPLTPIGLLKEVSAVGLAQVTVMPVKQGRRCFRSQRT
jgi:hypothetical protein